MPSSGESPARERLAGLVIVVVGALVLFFLMTYLPQGTGAFPYSRWAGETPHNFMAKLLWFIGDYTEPQFYKSIFASLGVLLGGWLAWRLDQNNSRWRGTPICYGTGWWPWVTGASLLALWISVFVANYTSLLASPRGAEIGWVPTFVPAVSMPAAVIFIYGPGWRQLLTGAVLGGLLGFPIAYFVIDQVTLPTGLPNVIGNVTAMWAGTIIVLTTCRHLPWMRRSVATEAAAAETDTGPAPEPVSHTFDRSWFIRRVLADFTEPQFFGNEVASVGLLLGLLVSWFWDASHAGYGSGLIPHIVLSQFLTAAIGIYLYYDRWRELGWYPTFVPVASVAPAIVLLYNGSWQSIVGGALFGAVAGPPLAQMVIDRLPGDWHPVIGNTFSMAITTMLAALVFNYLPGFGQP